MSNSTLRYFEAQKRKAQIARDSSPLLSAEEVAHRLNTSLVEVHRLTQAGQLYTFAFFPAERHYPSTQFDGTGMPRAELPQLIASARGGDPWALLEQLVIVAARERESLVVTHTPHEALASPSLATV